MTRPPERDRSLPPGLWKLAFGPLDDVGRPAAAAQRLEQSITIGLLPDGAQLPPESELAAQLNVSLVTLRSSLAILREKGLIDTRRGRTGGNFVVMPAADRQPLRQQLAALGIDAIRDRRDYYTAISGKAAELAATRARGRALAGLEEAAAAIGSTDGAMAAIAVDSRFHLQLAASTRSAMLTRAELDAQHQVTPLLWIPGLECLTTEDCGADHMQITDAIAARDGDRARKAAERHVGEAMNRLIEVRMRLSEV